MSDKIMKYFHMENYIEANEKDLIRYGIGQSIMFLISILVTLVLGALLGVLGESIVFLIFFIPLRMYAGGYHADSRKKCCVLSLCMIVICLYTIKNEVFLTSYLCLLISTVSAISIWLLAPVQNPNRELSEKEKSFFRQKTRAITICVYIIFMIAIVFNLTILAKIATVSLSLVCISLVVGWVKDRQKKEINFQG